MTEPFQRVAIDIVGPLPRTKRGNSFILSLIDYGSRYAEAIPLRTMDAKTVAEALMEIFSRLGVPAGNLNRSGIELLLQTHGTTIYPPGSKASENFSLSPPNKWGCGTLPQHPKSND